MDSSDAETEACSETESTSYEGVLSNGKGSRGAQVEPSSPIEVVRCSLSEELEKAEKSGDSRARPGLSGGTTWTNAKPDTGKCRKGKKVRGRQWKEERQENATAQREKALKKRKDGYRF